MARAKRFKTRYEGVYSRDLPSGRVYDITYRLGGRKIWESGFPSLAAAQERLAEQRLTARLGGPAPLKPKKLAQFIDDVWLPRQEARVGQEKLRSSTLRQYKRDLRLHIRPIFGESRLERIDLAAAQRFHDDLCNSQSNWSVLRIVNTLSSVLDMARKHGYIRFNPLHDVERVPARSSREPVILTLAEVWSLIEHAPDPHTACLILVSAFTGARQSEIFALRWPSVELTEGHETLTIREEYYRGELVGATKTAAGMRSVPIAAQVADALRAQYVRLQVDDRPNPHDLVFPAVKGGYWAASYFTSGPWAKTREAAGLSDLDFHDLRRFYISHIRNQKLSTAVTKQLVGHSDERTHEGYTHPIPGTESQIRDALSAAFPSPPGSTLVAPGGSPD